MIGIYIDKLNLNQESLTLILECNKLIEKNIPVVLFYNESGINPVFPKFGMSSCKELWSFEGNLITTSCRLAETCLNLPLVNDIYLYMDLEWMFNPSSVEYYFEIYKNERLKLIAQSKSHYGLIHRFIKQPRYIMNDFDHKILGEIYAQR